jgi:hypothetical protein
MNDRNLQREIDPDFFDVLLQSLTVLANVATMASTWIALRQDHQRARNENNVDAIRTTLRSLRRSLEDCFEAVENILRIMEIARHRAGVELLAERPQFGASVLLSQDELNRVFQHLNTLENAALQARQSARNIQALIQHTTLQETDHVYFDSDQFNADLNSVLFQSATFGDAMTKLRSVQRRAEDFVNDVERAMRRN